MTGGALMSPGGAVRSIAKMFGQDGSCKIAVREDRSFDGWWSLGDVLIDMIESDNRKEKDRRTVAALVSGAFEWRLPGAEDAARNLVERLGGKNEDDSECFGRKSEEDFLDGVNRALDEVALISVRMGLLHPVIDPAALEEMPFRRSTTVVSDTSGVLQGALDFVSRNLFPAARVKIPAIVHMEIVDTADRFFSTRRDNLRQKEGDNDNRKPKDRFREFVQHMRSQGGQHVLLRLELLSDVEIERTWLFGDPLRHAFREGQIRKNRFHLDTNVTFKSYADRLILEDARHHQAQSGPDHRVRLLTGDQGLARMALAEGVTPIYFSKTRAAHFFGSRLTGQTFDPFSGELQQTSLVSVLWELAVAFGSARIGTGDGAGFEISALGEGTIWSPYHSFDNLLWCKRVSIGRSGTVGGTTPLRGNEQSGQRKDRRRFESRTSDTAVEKKISFPRFNVGRLFRVICALGDQREMDNDQAMYIIGTRSSRGAEEYRRFLTSANLISTARGTWNAKFKLLWLSAALRKRAIEDIRRELEAAPSFSAFATHLRQLDIGYALDASDLDPSYGTHGAATFRTLGEVTLLCASAFGGGPYATPTVPDTEAFAEIALKRFSDLDRGDGLVTVGAWLETMIRDDGIHPEVARRKLEAANAVGLLRMSTEGSTPELRYDNRVVHVLRAPAGEPVVERVRLYRGDYLIPGKASVSLRIKGAGR